MPTPNSVLLGPLRRAKRYVCRWQTKFCRRGLILVYHRIAALDSDPWGTSVQEHNFREQLQVIREQTDPIPLQVMVNARSDRDLPPRPVSITFDDGYLDNLQTAAPLLAEFKMPATMFLTTGYFSAEREYWWDELDRLVLGPGPRPEVLEVEHKGRSYSWEAGNKTHSSTATETAWRAWEPALDPRQALYQSVYELLAPLPLEDKHAVLDQIRTWAGIPAQLRKNYRTVSKSEARELSARPEIEIGAHTVTHPVLSSLSPAEQRREIESSKSRLESLTGKRVTSFAYPYGKRFHYSNTTTALVKKCGFTCACSNFWGVVTTRTSRFALPRIQALDWGADKFSTELNEWFRG
jgi:peptidoglycan/xylan/chitin deacetylase (PgdA/CDA1 family)